MADTPRPRAVTIAGWLLIADAALAAVVIVANGVTTTEALVAVRIAGTLTLLAIAAFEAWIGRSVLRRRRWWLGIGFPGLFLLLSIAFPPWSGDPPASPASLAHGVASLLAWLFVVVALLRHRSWFTDPPHEVATG
jgi:hypothetical protein